MVTHITELTEAQRAQMPAHRDKWIKTGLSTDPMMEGDRKDVEQAIHFWYRRAGMAAPKAVIFVPSPFTLRVAAGIAGGAIYVLKQGRWPGQSASAVDSGVDSAVRRTVGSAVHSAVRSTVHSAVGNAVGSAVDSAVSNAVDSAVGNAVDSAVDSAVGSAVDSAVDSAVGNAVDSAVDSAVGNAVGSAVDSAVDSAVRRAVQSAFDIDYALGRAIDIDYAVRTAVRSAVESTVDYAVYDTVGRAVDDAVESAVRSAVDSNVHFLLRCTAEAYYAAWYGKLNSGWMAWCTFFRDVCELEIKEMDAFAAIEVMQSRCGPCTLHDDFAMVSDRPSVLKRDAGGRLHGEDGPAIAWRDTWNLFFWHGLLIPRELEWIIGDRGKLTPDAIEEQPNAELRRVMLEVFGFERYLEARDARVVAADELHGQPRRLLEVMVRGEPVRIIEVHDGSLAPDGSRRRYHLGAMPGKNPHEVVAASYGISPSVYRESVRT